MLCTPEKQASTTSSYSTATAEPRAEGTSIGSYSPGKSTKEPTSWASSDDNSDTPDEIPLTELMVGLISSTVDPKNLPFGRDSRKKAYTIPETGYELCWVTADELLTSVSGNHEDLHIPKTRRHPTLRLVSYGTRAANEALFACDTLRYHVTKLASKAGRNDAPPLQVLLFRHSENIYGKWSLVTDEITSHAPDNGSAIAAFQRAVELRLNISAWPFPSQLKESSNHPLPMDLVRVVECKLTAAMCIGLCAQEQQRPKEER